MLKLFDFQNKILRDTEGLNRVAYYLDMGLGKTFVASEKVKKLNSELTLIVCQKSKIDDWMEHFKEHYPTYQVTRLKTNIAMLPTSGVMVINYESVWRIPELLTLRKFTLVLDESQYIAHDTSKRTKFIMKLKPGAVILLSGTPTGGKYEDLYTQARLLGWNITKREYFDRYIITKELKINRFPIKKVVGYKNTDDLKNQLRTNGAVFLKTEEAHDLPPQTIIPVHVDATKDYKTFRKDRIITVRGTTWIGDGTLTQLLYSRKLCGNFNKNKMLLLEDLIESSQDRLVIFYNFQDEYDDIRALLMKLKRPVATVNGKINDLTNYETCNNSVTLVQYQAGSAGINLQKSNTIIYFTPPLSSTHFEQSKKRTHRIGQDRPCIYYELIVRGSVEEKIYNALAARKDYTDELFRGDFT